MNKYKCHRKHRMKHAIMTATADTPVSSQNRFFSGYAY